jgi:hypothetical protein
MTVPDTTSGGYKSGADQGFCVRGDESQRGIWGPLKVSSGFRTEPPPPKLLGFEYLGSFSVNNFEAFSPKSFKYILGSECKLKGDVT